MNKNIQLAYLAGFFDGEGTISILKRKKGNWNISHFIRVSIGQKDGAILDWVKDNFGGNLYKVKRDGSFTWILTDFKAYEFVKKMSPFLRYKKPQADLAIRFYEERIINSRRMTKHLHTALTSEELDLRETMYNEMKALKKIFKQSNYTD